MDKEAIETAISSLEAWRRHVDYWILISVAGVTILSAAAVVLAITNWLTEKRLRPLRAQQATLQTEEFVKLRKSAADEVTYRAGSAELARKFKDPRALSAAQQLRIADRLRQFAKTPFDLATTKHDTEPVAFLEQLSSALEAAGWIRRAHDGKSPALVTYGKPNIGIISGAFVGLEVGISDEKNDQWGAAVSALVAALQQEGITGVKMHNVMGGSSNAIHVVVGEKP